MTGDRTRLGTAMWRLGASLRRRFPGFRPVPSSSDVERAEQKFYLDYVRSGMTVFDVGANIGEFTLLFSRFVERGVVHSFEASLPAFIALKTVVQAAQRANVVVNHLALSDAPGVLQLHCYDGPYHSWNSMAKRPLAEYGIAVESSHVESAMATTVDAYCGEHDIARIDLLKVDVEGAELQVMRGARRMLEARAVACMAFEFGQTTFDMGNTPGAIEAFLGSCGYSITNLIPGEPVFPGGTDVRSTRFAMHLARPLR